MIAARGRQERLHRSNLRLFQMLNFGDVLGGMGELEMIALQCRQVGKRRLLIKPSPHAACAVLGSTRSLRLALEIAGGDFDRPFDDAPVPIDIFFEHGKAFGKLRDPVPFPVGLRSGDSADRLGRDNGDFFAQVFGDLLDRIGFEYVQLLEKAEQQQS